jgi:uncharacterized protein (DUF885 family)
MNNKHTPTNQFKSKGKKCRAALLVIFAVVLNQALVTAAVPEVLSKNTRIAAARQNDSKFEVAEKYLYRLADQFTAAILKTSQPTAYFYQLPIERHQHFIDNSAKANNEFQVIENRILSDLINLNLLELRDKKAIIFHSKFVEALQANIQQRVCKRELWNVNHMSNALIMLDFLVNVQPLSSQTLRSDALSRWGEAADYFRQEVVNLKNGLAKGYSAPKRVVRRVIEQHNSIVNIDIEKHPFLVMLDRTQDKSFKVAFKKLLKEKLLPAIKAYSDYLAVDYLPKARVPLGLHANPNGRACYMARYRVYTSLNRTPEQVFELGLAAVNANKAKVIELGQKFYHSNSFEQAVKLAKQDKQEKFSDAKALHRFFVGVVERAKRIVPQYFMTMPTISMEVEAIPEYQQGTGRSAHYVVGSKERAAKFGYDPTTFASETFGTAEIVSVHEGYPGHHLQIALVQSQANFHPIEAIFTNSAFSEGWARYAESLSEEAGIYQSQSAKILRRAWPARGMVADTAMHLLGWSDQQVAVFLSSSGASFADDPTVLMDRMAAIPAQLTSYDSGALEIFALREKMEKSLGRAFDIKKFHQLILKNGNVPMEILRQQVDLELEKVTLE